MDVSPEQDGRGPQLRGRVGVQIAHAVWLPRPHGGQRHRSRVNVVGDGTGLLTSAQAAVCGGFIPSPSLRNVLWGSRQQLCDRHPVLANTAAWLSRRRLLLTAVQGSLGTADPKRSDLRKELRIWGFPQDLLPPLANTQGPLQLIHGKWYILQSQCQENGMLLSNQTWFISQQVRAAEQVI